MFHQDIQRDPLYGSLFENMIIIDRLKSKLEQPLSSDYFKGLTKFKNASPETFLDGTLIYAGDQSQQPAK